MADISDQGPTRRSRGLYRSRRNRWIFGLCGGIAEYYDIDSGLVRLLMFLFTLTIIGILGYIIVALIVPEE